MVVEEIKSTTMLAELTSQIGYVLRDQARLLEENVWDRYILRFTYALLFRD